MQACKEVELLRCTVYSNLGTPMLFSFKIFIEQYFKMNSCKLLLIPSLFYSACKKKKLKLVIATVPCHLVAPHTHAGYVSFN